MTTRVAGACLLILTACSGGEEGLPITGAWTVTVDTNELPDGSCGGDSITFSFEIDTEFGEYGMLTTTNDRFTTWTGTVNGVIVEGTAAVLDGEREFEAPDGTMLRETVMLRVYDDGVDAPHGTSVYYLWYPDGSDCRAFDVPLLDVQH